MANISGVQVVSLTAAQSIDYTEPARRRRETFSLEYAPSTAIESITDTPPNGGYGWIFALGMLVINAHTWGINSSWAVILAYYSSHQTYQGATAIQYALIGGLSLSQAYLISPLATISSKHIGMRPSLFIGTVLVFLALFASSYATQIWHLFLTQGLCLGWGTGFLYIPASAALPAWFTTRRSLAVGLATSGVGFGGLLYSFVVNSAIQALGIAWAYRILAFCSLVANLSSLLLLKEYRPQGSTTPRNTTPRSATYQDENAFRLRDFGRFEVLLVVFWGITTDLGYLTLLYSIPSYASSIGLTATQGTIANALLNLGLGIARPALGYFSDLLGRINMAMFMTALCGISCFALWIPASGFTLLAIFALLAGCVCGTFWATVTPVLVEVVGLNKFTRIFEIVCLFLVLPTTFAEPVAMQLVGSGKVYLTAEAFVGCMFMAGALSLWVLRAWKIADLEIERSEGLRGLGSGSQNGPRVLVTPRERKFSRIMFKKLFKLKRV